MAWNGTANAMIKTKETPGLKRTCPACGNDFIPRVPWQIYNTKRCGSAARSEAYWRKKLGMMK